MQKLVVFLTLSIYMLSFSEVNQFLKLPFLVQHYHQHKLDEPGTNLIDFLKEHYTGIFQMDDDYQQDQQLPFRNCESPAHAVIVCSCNAVPIQLKPFEIVVERIFLLTNDQHTPRTNNADIFQPPRIV